MPVATSLSQLDKPRGTISLNIGRTLFKEEDKQSLLKILANAWYTTVIKEKFQLESILACWRVP